MAKNELSKSDDNRFGDNDSVKENIFMPSKIEDEKKFPNPKNKVVLVFKQNRTKELHVDGKIYRFVGPSSQEVSRSVIESTDFENQRRFFTVKEGV